MTGAVLSVHVIGIELNCNCLPDDTVHVPGFGGEDTVVLELDAVS
jgi:hypothetical protein